MPEQVTRSRRGQRNSAGVSALGLGRTATATTGSVRLAAHGAFGKCRGSEPPDGRFGSDSVTGNDPPPTVGPTVSTVGSSAKAAVTHKLIWRPVWICY